MAVTRAVMEISECIEEERLAMLDMRCQLLFRTGLRRVLADQLKELELEQECYCCMLLTDLDATRAAFAAWRAFVESMLDEHMFGVPYAVFLGDDGLVHKHDAIALAMGDLFRRRYECLAKYVRLLETR